MKKIILGMILGAGLTFGISAHAEVASMVGKVIDGEFTLTVNGRVLDQKAVVIQGTSYIPVRAFAEMVGYSASFDPTTGIQLNPIPIVVAPDPKLTVDPVSGDKVAMRREYILNRIDVLNVNIFSAKSGVETSASGSPEKMEYEKKLQKYEHDLAAYQELLKQYP